MARITLVAALALALAAPSVSATWMVAGSHEPDNSHDSTLFMWSDPPAPGQNRVYFNAVSTVRGQANPNAGALQSQIEPQTNEYHMAWFGVWQDCNGDGYVGHLESALREYPSTLLGDSTTCPPVVGPSDEWPMFAYNYNGWVSEFITIAGRTTGATHEATDDLRLIDDEEAMVWGDFGVWNEKPSQRSCTLAPQARGTWQSTGGTLNYVDCRTEILDQWNSAMDQLGDPAGLKFEDANDATVGDHPLDNPTLGSEDSSKSPATIWDCDAEPIAVVPTGPGGADVLSRDVTVWAVDPQVSSAPPTEWTVAGLVNATAEGLWLNLVSVDVASDGDCDFSNDRGEDTYGNGLTFYFGEEDFNGVDPEHKTEADWNLAFDSLGRGDQVTLGEDEDLGTPEVVLFPGVSPGPAGADGLYGVGQMSTVFVETIWESTSIWASKPGPSMVRANTDDPVAPAYFLSFYAHAGANTTAAVGTAGIPPGRGAYGSAQCNGATSGTHNGFECDPSVWYMNPDGSMTPEGREFDGGMILARPGMPYEFRDVDCYDGSVTEPMTGTEAGLQLSYYGSRPCQ